MAKLELFYPTKPYKVTQGFGIYNPAYQQFGFTKHNGIDILLEPDSIVHAMCEGVVTDVGYNSGAGNYVRYRTNDSVEAEGRTGYVQFMYMHADHPLVKTGDKVEAGTPLIVADNTGFSTGPHTHISAYFVSEAGDHELIGDKDSDYCFDHSLYFNKYYAEDANKVFGILFNIISLLTNFLSPK